MHLLAPDEGATFPGLERVMPSLTATASAPLSGVALMTVGCRYQYAPEPRSTTLNVLNRIEMSRQSDQFCTYATSSATRVA